MISDAIFREDGGQVDQGQEAIDPLGSMLVVPAQQNHWLAARSGLVRLQILVLGDQSPVSAVRDPMY